MTDALSRMGLKANATREDVAAAYRTMSKKLHPDVPATGSKEAFQLLQQTRDEALAEIDVRESNPFAGEWDRIHSMFTNVNVVVQASVTLEEAARGFTAAVNGSQVSVPGGLQPGVPEPIGRGISIRIAIRPHARFSACGGLDLACTDRIPFFDLVRGGTKRIETLYGAVDMAIPPMTNPGTIMSVNGYGYRTKSGISGNLRVKVEASMPEFTKADASLVDKLSRK